MTIDQYLRMLIEDCPEVAEEAAAMLAFRESVSIYNAQEAASHEHCLTINQFNRGLPKKARLSYA